MASRKLTQKGSVRVEGLKELGKQLKKLDDATSGKVQGRALEGAAEPVRAEAARLTPRSGTPGGTTGKGHAADHISIKVVDKGKRNKEAHIGPERDFWYLVFSEFGTPNQPALAPLRTAADTKFKEAVTEFRDVLRAEIGRVL